MTDSFETVVFDTVVFGMEELSAWVVMVELGTVDDWGIVVEVELATGAAVVSTPTLYIANSEIKFNSYVVQVSVLVGKQKPTRAEQISFWILKI